MRFLLALCLTFCFTPDSFALETVNRRLLDHARACPEQTASNVPDLVTYLRKAAASENQLVEIFSYWIADNIAYDTDALSDRSYTPTAKAFAERKGVCQNHAELLQQMCRLTGIECYVVGGYCKSYDYRKNTRFTEADHAWNVVKVNGKYVPVDITWASGYLEDRQGTLVFRKELKVSEIMADPDYFIARRLPADPRWQLRERPITMRSFESNDSVSHMSKQTAGYYNFTDSIAAYRKSDSIRQTVIDAESAYRFNPVSDNLARVADAYYNQGWYFAVNYPDAVHYRLSIESYEKAIARYTRLNNGYGARWIATSRKSIAYMKARLKEWAASS
jgi:transglutaminase-like putative cysteine protease